MPDIPIGVSFDDLEFGMLKETSIFNTGCHMKRWKEDI